MQSKSERLILYDVEIYSSKNSKRIFYKKKQKRHIVLMSKGADMCYREILKQIDGKRLDMPTPPYLHYLFIRKTLRKFDYNNISQLINDALVKAKCIEDDDFHHLIPVFYPILFGVKPITILSTKPFTILDYAAALSLSIGGDVYVEGSNKLLLPKLPKKNLERILKSPAIAHHYSDGEDTVITLLSLP
ncbi:MAG: hypothetical protein KatS3mg083_513 [Candidatus Dojkabacteria bacterium]|nr:MAG: hypothetical protein KatS3mg083_513 [Candidatus Dojkabacteria bacterium]